MSYALLGVGLTESERALTESPSVVCEEVLYQRLYALGVRSAGFNGNGPFDALAYDAVCLLPNARFAFARDLRDASSATVAVLIPVCGEAGEIVDICAWHVDDDMVALWRDAVPGLGFENLDAPRLGEPLVVHETPAAWLRAERSGIFILDYQRAAQRIAPLRPTLGVMSASFGRRLHSKLAIPPPPIVVNMRSAP